MISRAENINPSILIWARETAGLSVEDAAARLGLTSGAGGIEDSVYGQLAAAYAVRWRDARARRRELSQEEPGSGPSYYTVRKHRLGNRLLRLISRTLRSNELTHTKAAKMLGVKPSRFEPLLKGVANGSYSPQSG